MASAKSKKKAPKAKKKTAARKAAPKRKAPVKKAAKKAAPTTAAPTAPWRYCLGRCSCGSPCTYDSGHTGSHYCSFHAPNS